MLNQNKIYQAACIVESREDWKAIRELEVFPSYNIQTRTTDSSLEFRQWVTQERFDVYVIYAPLKTETYDPMELVWYINNKKLNRDALSIVISEFSSHAKDYLENGSFYFLQSPILLQDMHHMREWLDLILWTF